MTVKLHNRGQNPIEVAKDKNKKAVVLRPGQTMIFTDEDAAKLRRLYPQDVIDQSAALDPFNLGDEKKLEATEVPKQEGKKKPE